MPQQGHDGGRLRQAKDKRTGRPARRLLTLSDIGAKFVVGERTAHDLTQESWFPAAIDVGPRLRRWDEDEIDAAIAAHAPRRAHVAEPAQLAKARKQAPSNGPAT